MLELFRYQARRLRQILERFNIAISHTTALNTVAGAYGLDNWHRLKSSYNTSDLPEWVADDFASRLQSTLKRLGHTINMPNALRAIQHAYVISNEELGEVLSSIVPKRTRALLKRGMERSASFRFVLQIGQPPVLQNTSRPIQAEIADVAVITQTDLIQMLRVLPPCTQATATPIPGTLARIYRTDTLEGTPSSLAILFTVQTTVEHAVHVSRQDWNLLLVTGERNVRSHGLRTAIAAIAAAPSERVLVCDPDQYVTAARWDVAAISPRAMALKETEFPNIDSMLAILKKFDPTVVVLVDCIGERQIPVARYLLERGVRVVYDVYTVEAGRQGVDHQLPTDQLIHLRI